MYKVRKSWDKPGTQLGAYVFLANAKAVVAKHPGYKVYSEGGKQVYPVNVSAGEKAVKKATLISKEMVRKGYHYKRPGESSATSWRKSGKTKACTCTRLVSWVLQESGHLPEGVCIGHALQNKGKLKNCQIIKVRKPFKALLKNRTLKPGDCLISNKKTCGNNYASIFAGYNSGKRYWFEAGGPFHGTNCEKKGNRYINCGPLYVGYDYNHVVEYIIRPR